MKLAVQITARHATAADRSAVANSTGRRRLPPPSLCLAKMHEIQSINLFVIKGHRPLTHHINSKTITTKMQNYKAIKMN